MPVRNEEAFIESILMELLEQNYPSDKFEIIIADGESDDSTPEIVRAVIAENPQVKFYLNPKRLSGAGRNIAFKHGMGSIFLVVDGHCTLRNKNLLRNVVDCFEKSNADCLGRPQPFIIPDSANFARAIALARSSWCGHNFKSFIHTQQEGYASPVSVGCAYKKHVFDKIGYIDERFDACEDVEFNYRVEKAGFLTYFCPKIAVHYYPRESLKEMFKQMLRYSEGRVQFLVKYPRDIQWEAFLPSLFLISVLLGPLAGALSSTFFFLYCIFIILYLFLISLESFRLTKQHGIIFFLKLFMTFLGIHVSLGLGFLKYLFKKIL